MAGQPPSRRSPKNNGALMAGRASESALAVNPSLPSAPDRAVRTHERAPPAAGISELAIRPGAERRGRWVSLVLPVGLALLWQLVSQLGWVKPYFLPSPLTVARAANEMIFETGLLKDTWFSLRIISEGAFLGGLLGLAFGFAAGISRSVEKLVTPLLDAVRQVPPLAWIPLLVLWLGVGNSGKVVLIAKAVFFPVFLNTLQGIRGVSLDQIEVGRIFGYGRLRLLRRIIIPSALPSIFVGLRFAAGLSWSVMIAAELLGSRYGLGFRLHLAQEHLMTDQLFVIIILIGLVGYLLDLTIRTIQGRVLHWRRNFVG